jgi:hypothetical protein
VEKTLAFGFEAMGPQTVKILPPVPAFRVKLNGIPRQRQRRAVRTRPYQVWAGALVLLIFVVGTWFLLNRTDIGLGKQAHATTPSLAVLPFDNMSGSPEQQYFSDGISEDLITELSRFRSLFVIARNFSFQYRVRTPDIKQVGRAMRTASQRMGPQKQYDTVIAN